MSIRQFEKRLRSSEQLRPYRRLTALTYAQMNPETSDAEEPTTQSGWWPWLDTPPD